ncbi:hypothetical protein FH972_024187 [Carpinus fangiana]|uniref:Symplekin/Pta1 N-terminal domain-containing protein n=1 Tax=Carpinus fangiana TaxID=176857 RepID=A0A5N6KXN6_9ROSI|nr:hypothetical protein FH972_024187 [Carpinus fangiana]
MAANDSSESTISRLEGARKLALSDSVHYPAIVQGVAPIIGQGAALDLRRWGADFLAETYASPAFAVEEKVKLSFAALPILKAYLEADDQDDAVVKSSVQAATSMYPLVFRHTIYTPTDITTWQNMAAIKSSILRRMDSAAPGVKLCCTKFIQRVIQMQTPGVISDPRRPDQNEISLSLVPRDHPLIPPSTLEAEALGLLDRLLDVFQNPAGDALQVTATLNSVGVLVRTRASIANRILNTILSFDPFRLAYSGTMDAKTKVMVKSMERTLKAFLINLNKRNPTNPMAGRIQGHLDRLAQMHNDAFDTTGRKRAAPLEPPDGLDPSKRQRLAIDAFGAPALPPGPVSMAQLFTLTADDTTKGFNVQTIPFNMVNRIVVPLLVSVNQDQLTNAVSIVKQRLQDLSGSSSATAIAQALTGAGQGLDNGTNAASDQLMNRMEAGPVATDRPPEVPTGPFIIPQPPPMEDYEVTDFGKEMVLRIFGMVETSGETALFKMPTKGFNRVAGSNYDRDGWVTIAVRLATRTTTGLEASGVKEEDGSSGGPAFSLATEIRNVLHQYVLSDFRRRIGVAISWLNEEWYNDRMRSRSDADAAGSYDGLVLRLLDGMLPYLDAKDKVLIRFLSEVPAVGPALLERVKRLAVDPERVALAVNAIHYLVLFRPPVREICIDALEDLWHNYEDARGASAKVLAKWRPEVLGEAAPQAKVEEAKPEVAAKMEVAA